MTRRLAVLIVGPVAAALVAHWLRAAPHTEQRAMKASEINETARGNRERAVRANVSRHTSTETYGLRYGACAEVIA